MAKTKVEALGPELMENGHYKSPPGMSVLSSRKLNPTRMRKLLGGIGLTASQHGVWVGWPLAQYIKANPGQTERFWFDLVAECYELIKDPPPLVQRKA